MSEYTDTTPSKFALCVLLAKDKHMPGGLLYLIVGSMKYADAQLPDTEGHWIARDSKWWCREADLTPRQFDRALANLDEWGLIDRCQAMHGSKNILHLRPTALTTEYLAVATTWEFAKKLQPTMPGSKSNSANIGKPDQTTSSSQDKEPASSGNPMLLLPVSLELAKIGKPSAPVAGGPKSDDPGKPTMPVPATQKPASSGKLTFHKSIAPGHAALGKQGMPISEDYPPGKAMLGEKQLDMSATTDLSLKQAAPHADQVIPAAWVDEISGFWEACVLDYFGDVAEQLVPLSRGDKATLMATVKAMTADWSAQDHILGSKAFKNVIIFLFKNWGEFESKSGSLAETPGHPSVQYFLEHWDDVGLELWAEAGNPEYVLPTK